MDTSTRDDRATRDANRRPRMGIRPRWLAAALVAVLAAVVALALFQPWKLFVDQTVVEQAPAGPTSTTLASGSFVSLAHPTTGAARVVRSADGTLLLRLEGLDTTNGPDLHVWISPMPTAAGEDAFAAGHLDLGRLKGNRGDQNYPIPADVDPASFASVVVWCQRFSVGFGAADLAPAR